MENKMLTGFLEILQQRNSRPRFDMFGVNTLESPLHAILTSQIAEQYSAGLLSLGRAAEIAGLPYDRMIDELTRRGIGLNLGPSSISEAVEDEERIIASIRKRRSS
jgi:hypothetical protein